MLKLKKMKNKIKTSNYIFTQHAKDKVSLYNTTFLDVVSELRISTVYNDPKSKRKMYVTKYGSTAYSKSEYRKSEHYIYVLSKEYIDDKPFYRVITFYPINRY